MLGLLLFAINVHHVNAYVNYSVDAVQGSTVILTCQGTGTSYEWTLFFKTLIDGIKYENTKTSQMTIRNVDVNDSAAYFCRSTDVVTEISLNVIVYAEKGSTVVWKCPSSSTNYRWQKYINSSWLTLNDDSKYINANTSQITIGKVDYTDNGQYHCIHNEILSFTWTMGEIILYVKETENDKFTPIKAVLVTIGSAGVLIITVTIIIVVAFIKRRRATLREKYDYTAGDNMDNTEVEQHRYHEMQFLNSTESKSTAYAYPSSILKSNQNSKSDGTFKTYNVRDFMHYLQDRSLAQRLEMEYQLLYTTHLPAVLDYQNLDRKLGAAADRTRTNKSQIKKQDDDNGYIITTVPDRKEIDNFWTMITDSRARYIILLAQRNEKITRFFPSTDVTIDTSKFKVKLSSCEKYQNNIFAFILDVWNKEKTTAVQVKLWKTTDWNVDENHPSIDTLSTLLDVVRNQESVTTVLIGSTGIGFPVCGIFGVCYEVFRAIKSKKDFSILQIVLNLKKKQADLFQTFEEYNLCYKVIGNVLENEHIYDVID